MRAPTPVQTPQPRTRLPWLAVIAVIFLLIAVPFPGRPAVRAGPYFSVASQPTPTAGGIPNGTLRGNVTPVVPSETVVIMGGAVGNRVVAVSNGQYSVSLAPSQYLVSAHVPGFPPSAFQSANIVPMQTTWINFDLTAGTGWVAGQVSPSSAHVTIGKIGSVPTVVHLDGGGNFNVSESPGDYDLNVTSTGYMPEVDLVLINAGSSTWDNVSLESNSSGSSLFATPAIDALVAVGVLVVLGVVAFVLLRRRKPEPPPPAEPEPEARTNRRRRKKSARPPPP